jgi:predicted dehydrogenase
MSEIRWAIIGLTIMGIAWAVAWSDASRPVINTVCP